MVKTGSESGSAKDCSQLQGSSREGKISSLQNCGRVFLFQVACSWCLISMAALGPQFRLSSEGIKHHIPHAPSDPTWSGGELISCSGQRGTGRRSRDPC